MPARARMVERHRRHCALGHERHQRASLPRDSIDTPPEERPWEAPDVDDEHRKFEQYAKDQVRDRSRDEYRRDDHCFSEGPRDLGADAGGHTP